MGSHFQSADAPLQCQRPQETTPNYSQSIAAKNERYEHSGWRTLWNYSPSITNWATLVQEKQQGCTDENRSQLLLFQGAHLENSK